MCTGSSKRNPHLLFVWTYQRGMHIHYPRAPVCTHACTHIQTNILHGQRTHMNIHHAPTTYTRARTTHIHMYTHKHTRARTRARYHTHTQHMDIPLDIRTWNMRTYTLKTIPNTRTYADKLELYSQGRSVVHLFGSASFPQHLPTPPHLEIELRFLWDLHLLYLKEGALEPNTALCLWIHNPSNEQIASTPIVFAVQTTILNAIFKNLNDGETSRNSLTVYAYYLCYLMVAWFLWYFNTLIGRTGCSVIDN